MTVPVRFEDPRSVLKRHGLSPKHSWGQNFLISGRAVTAIVHACADQPGRKVLEIGAGLGTLTGALLDAGSRVTALERDREMCEVLRQEFGDNPDFTLAEADAATFDYPAFLANEPAVIAGNLPYQLTGRLLRLVLASCPHFLRAVLMVQEEVANRVIAREDDKGRSALSVNAQVRCRSKIVHRLGPGAFYPKPKVRSAVMELTPLEEPFLTGERDETDFEAVVKAAFSCRRKTIRNALSIGGLGAQEQVVRLLEEAGIDPGLRPGSLSVQDFLHLAKRFGAADRH